MHQDTFIELESAAKALDLSDLSTASVCLRKAMDGSVEMTPPSASPEPSAIDPKAELAKAINALEIKEFSLAGLCCDKAARGLQYVLPSDLNRTLAMSGRALRSQDFSSLANQLRAVVRFFRPDLTTPPPAEAPNVKVETPEARPQESELVVLPVTQAVIP